MQEKYGVIAKGKGKSLQNLDYRFESGGHHLIYQDKVL